MLAEIIPVSLLQCRFFREGVVLDAVAAEVLLNKGIDIGIKSITKAFANPVKECFGNNSMNGRYVGENILLYNYRNVYYECEPRAGAVILSRFIDDRGNDMYAGTILYENANGQRFCILPYDMRKATACLQLIYGYAKQEQLTECITWAGREPLPVSIRQPDIHIMCKAAKDGSRIAIAVQNCHLDTLENPVLLLNPGIKTGSKIELMLPDAERTVLSSDFEYKSDGKYGYLEIRCLVHPLGFLGIGLKQK